MRNIIIALVAVVLLTTNAFALDVIVQNAQLYKNAKQFSKTAYYHNLHSLAIATATMLAPPALAAWK